MYVYKVRQLIRVIDGDTVDAALDLGFGMTATLRFRLAGIDTPEVYGTAAVEQGRAAMDFTFGWLDQRKDRLQVKTFKGSWSTVGVGDGAFGRWLADFHTPEGEHLVDALKAAGHVKPE